LSGNISSESEAATRPASLRKQRFCGVTDRDNRSSFACMGP
jgi:hypothetical protein